MKVSKLMYGRANTIFLSYQLWVQVCVVFRYINDYCERDKGMKIWRYLGYSTNMYTRGLGSVREEDPRAICSDRFPWI